MCRLKISDKTSFPLKAPEGKPLEGPQGPPLEGPEGGPLDPAGKRQSGVSWRLDLPLWGETGAPPRAPPGALGAPEPQQLSLKGALEIEAQRQQSVFARAEREGPPSSAEGTEAPSSAGEGPPKEGWGPPCNRRSGSFVRRGLQAALGGPNLLSVSEVSVHPKLRDSRLGYDTAKATVSLSAAGRQASDPLFLGPVSSSQGPPRRGLLCGSGRPLSVPGNNGGHWEAPISCVWALFV